MNTTRTREHADLLEALETHRSFLRHTVAGLTDDQARLKPTASALCLGGLIKHVAHVESGWVDFVLGGPEAIAATEDSFAAHAASFEMTADDTIESLLAHYNEVARCTDEVLMSLENLDDSQPLPEAPWFPPGATWSARRSFVHIVAETAQHAGHADIVRESIDGAKTMG